jgi:hypothetical protein
MTITKKAAATATTTKRYIMYIADHEITISRFETSLSVKTYVASVRLGFSPASKYIARHRGLGETPYCAALSLSDILSAVADTIDHLQPNNPLATSYHELSRALIDGRQFKRENMNFS